MLALLRRRPDSSGALIRTLRAFVGLLEPGPAPGHLEGAEGALARAMEALAGQSEIPWGALLDRTAPGSLDLDGEATSDLDGVAVFSASREPWRSVRHLFLLGFNEGRFPSRIPVDPVLGVHGVEAISEAGLAVRTAADRRRVGRQLLLRQLRCASESATLMVPACDLSGEALYPSETLGYMARLFQEEVEPEALIRSIDHPEELAGIRGISSLSPQAPINPRSIIVEDLFFDRDLTALRRDADGNPKPESPSGLEKLLVSPLGWLLSRAGLEPGGWAPPGFDVMLQGNVAHKVFEELFRAGEAIPAVATIGPRLASLLRDVLADQARHLDPRELWMEFDNLEGTLRQAAEAWAGFLREAGAEIVCNERRLKGEFDGLPIRGSADSILCLADDSILVVDFKKSKSSKRIGQLEAGYDLQTTLYRLMLAGKDFSDLPSPLWELILGGHEVGVAYFTLNDGKVVAAHLPEGSLPGRGVELVAGEAARESGPLLMGRLDRVREGQVPLNRMTDEAWFTDQASITPYALDTSPLVRFFMLPEEVES